MRPIKILIAGYGVFGSQLVNYLNKTCKNICIQAVIEPNRHKRDLLKKINIRAYEHIFDISPTQSSEIDIVVDCSPRGQGIENKKLYVDLNLKAIFQNGEECKDVGLLYYPGLTNTKDTKYLKVPLCSGIAVIKVLDALRTQNTTLPDFISATHSKVTNTARMLTMNYQDSIEQILELFNIQASMDVVYLRGEPYANRFTYFGNVQLHYSRELPDLRDVYKALKDYPTINFTSQDMDLLTNKRAPIEKTLIVRESLRMNDRFLSFVNISDTPNVNFPIVVEAIKSLTNS